MSKILYIDMDGVLADFKGSISKIPQSTFELYNIDPSDEPDKLPGFFSKLEPMPHAIEAVTFLSKHFECYVLSTAPWKNPSAWTDKLVWIQTYFPDIFYKRLILSHNKGLVKGDYIIDDRGLKGVKDFEGEWIHFNVENKHNEWKRIMNYLIEKENLPRF